ncbi:uncharacterized protein VP01_1529g3 [Puccinia sorghi]|uniref:Uncharacterized protein n=1 Tax=Puccinia sorghi TaxID=27349 RepID=A0A0L6VKF6_9BASI|nr:uncharacterized protein VP01_1529g3 [Puccinia sorghi]
MWQDLLWIITAVVAFKDYFVQKRNTAGKLGFSPHQKMTVALMIFSHDEIGD